MWWGLPLLGCAALLAASCTSDRPVAEAGRVMVIGIDGGTWTMLEPLMQAGELPNLKTLRDEGLHGVLESRPPFISPVAWTTIFTGVGHERHGVTDWTNSLATHRRVDAVWQMANKAGRRTHILNVPATWPPQPVLGVMVSGFPLRGSMVSGSTGEVVRRSDLDAGTLPPAYLDSVEQVRAHLLPLAIGQWSGWFPVTLAARPGMRGVVRGMRLADDRFYLSPLYRVDDDLVITQPQAVRGELSTLLGEPYIPEGPGWSRWREEDTLTYLSQHLEQVFSLQARAARQYVQDPWDLFVYVMTLVDRVSHPYWAYAHAADFPKLDPQKARQHAAAVPDAYRRSDEELGRLLRAASGEFYVLVVSDHGFRPSADRDRFTGTHHPDGIYLLWGPGISPRRGERRFIEDVTPTVLYLMGLPAGRDMQGTLFPEVQAMLGRQPQFVDSYEVAEREPTAGPIDDATWEQLRGLGYVDGPLPRSRD